MPASSIGRGRAARRVQVPASGIGAAVQPDAFGPTLVLLPGHGEHSRSALALPAFDTKVSDGQFVQPLQPVALVLALKLLAPQGPHTRSVVVVPSVATNEPGLQDTQALHMPAFEVVLNDPLAQSAQVRSRVAEPAWATLCPGPQLLQLAHAEAGLPSLSQLPFPHDCAAAVPPGQY